MPFLQVGETKIPLISVICRLVLDILGGINMNKSLNLIYLVNIFRYLAKEHGLAGEDPLEQVITGLK